MAGKFKLLEKRLKKLGKQNLIERKKYKSEKGTDADYFLISEKTIPDIFLYLLQYMYKKVQKFIEFSIKFLSGVPPTGWEDTSSSKIFKLSVEDQKILNEFLKKISKLQSKNKVYPPEIPSPELQSKIISILSEPSIFEYIRKEGNGFKLDDPKSHTSRYGEVIELLHYFYVTVYSFSKGDLTEGR
jgi:hypothetical protein